MVDWIPMALGILSIHSYQKLPLPLVNNLQLMHRFAPSPFHNYNRGQTFIVVNSNRYVD